MDSAAVLRSFPVSQPGHAPIVRAVSTVMSPTNAPCEDGFVVCTNLQGRPESLYAVIDGHGGPGVKDILIDRLPGLIVAQLNMGKTGETALKSMIEAAEGIILEQEALREVGACAVAVLCTPGAEEEISVASVGDCAAVAAYYFESGLQHHRMSGTPHNLSEGIVLHQALTSQTCALRNTELDGKHDDPGAAVLQMSPFKPSCKLQLTRAIGDAVFKTPTTVDKTPIKGNKRSRASGSINRASLDVKPNQMSESVVKIAFIVLCSDGITDELSDGEIVAIVSQHVLSGHSRETAAAALQLKAVERAAFKNDMPLADILATPPGDARRKLVDDQTAVVLFLSA